MYLKILALIILIINCVYGKHQRIIGGYNAERHEFPYQAELKSIDYNIIICGGAIISHYHILTAAQCVDEYSVSHHDLRICLGGANRTHLFTSEYLLTEIYIHPDYVRDNIEVLVPANDIAVIKINGNIPFNHYQSKIQLPDRDIEYNKLGLLSGWGTVTNITYTFPPKLQKMLTLITEPAICNRQLPFDIYDNDFCGFVTTGVGPCTGDTGNPLVIDNKVVGLFSVNYLCASGFPDVYTNVYAHKLFILMAVAS